MILGSTANCMFKDFRNAGLIKWQIHYPSNGREKGVNTAFHDINLVLDLIWKI